MKSVSQGAPRRSTRDSGSLVQNQSQKNVRYAGGKKKGRSRSEASAASLSMAREEDQKKCYKKKTEETSDNSRKKKRRSHTLTGGPFLKKGSGRGNEKLPREKAEKKGPLAHVPMQTLLTGVTQGSG